MHRESFMHKNILHTLAKFIAMYLSSSISYQDKTIEFYSTEIGYLGTQTIAWLVNVPSFSSEL